MSDTPENFEESQSRPPRPVPDPDLPMSGDPEEFDEEEVPEEDYNSGGNGEGSEPLEPPNDLSNVEKEFDE